MIEQLLSPNLTEEQKRSSSEIEEYLFPKSREDQKRSKHHPALKCRP